MTSAVRVVKTGRPVDLGLTLGPLVRGAGDPAHRFVAGRFWWACRTPAGSATLSLAATGPAGPTSPARTAVTAVTAQAWGAGADWLLARVPDLIGEQDDWSGLELGGHPGLRDCLRRRPGLRLCATGLVLDSLVPAILEQKVTGAEARRSWRNLLFRYGTPAPGPTPVPMRVPPTAEVLREIPTWDWHRFGVDLKRHAAIRAAASVAGRLEEAAAMSPGDALTRLRHVPGVGEWTAAETAQRAVGHPDAVSVGDFHTKNLVVHALTGRARGSDREMLELLSPWAGHRQRVVRLIELGAGPAPRFGPRFAPNDIRAI